MENKSFFAAEILKELNAEATATRKCLEQVSEKLFDWKPHEKSMNLGYLALLVAEIPKWIHAIIERDDLDLATFEHLKPQSADELVAHFDENLELARRALEKVSDEDLTPDFPLKVNGEVVFSAPKRDHIASAVNHQVHHRGQLTVYMRLNDLPVPSIYGPSADAPGF